MTRLEGHEDRVRGPGHGLELDDATRLQRHREIQAAVPLRRPPRHDQPRPSPRPQGISLVPGPEVGEGPPPVFVRVHELVEEANRLVVTRAPVDVLRQPIAANDDLASLGRDAGGCQGHGPGVSSVGIVRSMGAARQTPRRGRISAVVPPHLVLGGGADVVLAGTALAGVPITMDGVHDERGLGPRKLRSGPHPNLRVRYATALRRFHFGPPLEEPEQLVLAVAVEPVHPPDPDPALSWLIPAVEEHAIQQSPDVVVFHAAVVDPVHVLDPVDPGSLRLGEVGAGYPQHPSNHAWEHFRPAHGEGSSASHQPSTAASHDPSGIW